jgi:hypothetical protein
VHSIRHTGDPADSEAVALAGCGVELHHTDICTPRIPSTAASEGSDIHRTVRAHRHRLTSRDRPRAADRFAAANSPTSKMALRHHQATDSFI